MIQAEVQVVGKSKKTYTTVNKHTKHTYRPPTLKYHEDTFKPDLSKLLHAITYKNTAKAPKVKQAKAII